MTHSHFAIFMFSCLSLYSLIYNDDLQREKEEALKIDLELKRNQDAKHNLEREINELQGKVQVMAHLGDKNDAAVQEQIKKMNDELQAKNEEMEVVENLYQTLLYKERQSNDELQKARKELIKVLHSNI